MTDPKTSVSGVEPGDAPLALDASLSLDQGSIALHDGWVTLVVIRCTKNPEYDSLQRSVGLQQQIASSQMMGLANSLQEDGMQVSPEEIAQLGAHVALASLQPLLSVTPAALVNVVGNIWLAPEDSENQQVLAALTNLGVDLNQK